MSDRNTRRRNQISWLGIGMQGDIATFTTWKTRQGRQAFMAREPAGQPPSDKQRYYRARFTAAASAWKALSSQTRANYEQATLKLHFQMSGYNLFVRCHTRDDWRDASNASRLTGLDLSI